MAKSSIKCPKCPRRFSMAAHLQRHLNSTHGGRGGKKRAARKRSGAGGRRRGRPLGSKMNRRSNSLGIMGSGSISAVQLLGNMQTVHAELLDQRNAIDREIDVVTQAMRVMGAHPAAGGRKPRRPVGRPKRRGPGRPKGSGGGRSGSLKDFIVRVLGQTTQALSPQDIGQRVKQAGFKTKARDLTKAVSNTLPDVKGIKRVGFGQYRLT